MLLWCVGDRWADFEPWLQAARFGLLFVPESGDAYLVDVVDGVVDVFDHQERTGSMELVQVLTASPCGLVLVTRTRDHWSSHFLPPIVAVVQPWQHREVERWPAMRSPWLPAPEHPRGRCGALYCGA